MVGLLAVLSGVSFKYTRAFSTCDVLCCYHLTRRHVDNFIHDETFRFRYMDVCEWMYHTMIILGITHTIAVRNHFCTLCARRFAGSHPCACVRVCDECVWLDWSIYDACGDTPLCRLFIFSTVQQSLNDATYEARGVWRSGKGEVSGFPCFVVVVSRNIIRLHCVHISLSLYI